MSAIVLALIIVGVVIMAANILGYILLLKNIHDVLSSGRKLDDALLFCGFGMLIFFLVGYLLVGILFKPNLMVALILFFGSIFVFIILLLIKNIMNTAKERSLEVTELLVGVLDARDPNLNGHSIHVKNLAMLFYNHLPHSIKSGINPISLNYAALMHDIGKLGVPEAILNKPAALSDEEWKIMRTHPQVGVKLLKPLKSFDSITNWVLFHHERIDGAGYYKKPNEEIPVEAKLLAIVDTYSAITMRRSYKTPRTHEDAVRILKEVAGTQLDKDLVDIFLSIPKEELEKCMPEQVKY